jgi:hypothetical protein
VPDTTFTIEERTYTCYFEGCTHRRKLILPVDAVKKLLTDRSEGAERVATIEKLMCPTCTVPVLRADSTKSGMYMAALSDYLGAQPQSTWERMVDALALRVRLNRVLPFDHESVQRLTSEFGEEYVLTAWLHLAGVKEPAP